MTETSCTLPEELVRPIIILCVRSLPPFLLPPDQVSLAAALNLVPYLVVPEASHIGITKMPHMRMEIGVRIGSVHLLDLLLKMTRPPFNRPLQYNQEKVIRLAIGRGHVHVLDWWVANGLPLGNKFMSYSEMPEFASVEVRNWCLDQGFVFYPDVEKKRAAMDWTPDLTPRQACALELSAKGRLFALEWWLKDDRLTLETQEVDGTRCMLVALCCGHFEVAQWWIKSGLCSDFDSIIVTEPALTEFDLSDSDQALAFGKRVVDAFSLALASRGDLDQFFIMACASGQIELAQYYFGLPLSRLTHASLDTYSDQLYGYAAAIGNVTVLDWLHANGFLLANNLTCPTLDNFMYVYPNWEYLAAAWKSSCPGIETSSCTLLLDLVSQRGHVAVLVWLRRRLDSRAFSDMYAQDSMDAASRAGHIDVLQWWLDSGLDYKYSGRAIKGACKTGNIDVLDWWDNSGIYKRKRKWASFGEMSEWLSSYDVFEWWRKASQATRADLEKLKRSLTYCDDWTIIEWYRRFHDSAVLDTLRHVLTEDFCSAYPTVLTVFALHGLAAIPTLTDYQFGTLASHGSTVFLEQMRLFDLLPEVINLNRMDESEVFGGSGGEEDGDLSDWVWPISTLNWLLKSGHPLEWSEEALKTCTRMKRMHLLEWWAASGLELKVDAGWNPMLEWEESDDDAGCDKARSAVMSWWEARPNLLSF